MLGFISERLLKSGATKSLISSRFVASSVRHLPAITTLSDSNPSCGEDSKSVKFESFTVSYLIDSCGLTPEAARSAASRTVRLTSPERPNVVLEFLKHHGFNDEQVSSLVAKRPSLIMADPEAMLKPKFELLSSLGMPERNVVQIMLRCPQILHLDVDKVLQPSVIYLRNILGSVEDVHKLIAKAPNLLRCYLPAVLALRVEFLQKEGVPNDVIVAFLRHHPTGMLASVERLKEIIRKVKEMGFDLTTYKFFEAVGVLATVNEKTCERKVENFKKLGFSDVQVVTMFKRMPICMYISEKKVGSIVQFLVNALGLDIMTDLAHNPTVLKYSLKQRITPRLLIFQYLVSKEVLTRNEFKFSSIMDATEESFFKLFVERYKEVLPELHDLYTKYKEHAATGDSLAIQELTF